MKNIATREEAKEQFVKHVHDCMLQAANHIKECLIEDFKWNLIWQLRYEGLLDKLKFVGDITLRDIADFAYHWDLKVNFHLEPVEESGIIFTDTGMERTDEQE